MIFACATYLHAAEIPALPKLPIDSFKPPMRDQVRAAYEVTLKNPQAAGSNGQLGMILYAYEQFEFAETCFERARAFDTKDQRWTYYLGRTRAALGKHDQAAISLREALQQEPEYLPAQLMLGESLFAAGKLDECRKICEAAIKKHPDSAAAYYWLGKVQASRRDFASAVELLRKACELYSNFGAAHYALALAYRDLGESAQAQEHVALYLKDKLGWPSTPDPLIGAIDDLKTGAATHLKKGVRLEAAGQMEGAVEEHERAPDPDLGRHSARPVFDI